MAVSGSVVWPSAANPIWRFNWTLANSPDAEGIVISNAYFNGHQVFYKASLPSLRVQYDGPCGPYKDPLNFDNAHPTSGNPNPVSVYTIGFFGFTAVVVEGYHTIGHYRLTERWYFWVDGHIAPRLSSAGLQCNYNHRHHVYWRFDFDIDGSTNELALEYNTTTPNLGWGPGWHTKQHEIVRVKSPVTRRCWAILDKGTQRGYMIMPGPSDGSADAFSSGDLWVLRYRASEDQHGRQGSAWSDDLAPLVSNVEPTDGEDLVIWYCAHIHHEAAEGEAHVHTAGPDLIPFRY